ncbi:MAG: type I glutamate--ammonia ligase [Thaumarchaeota archaeon]|nr:type I glutamate--ammonia ligase [Nitrososphaerota archaeon]MCL5317385.1 type I glutamate--ammonia ligase [Nitrososphaerota archaeon]
MGFQRSVQGQIEPLKITPVEAVDMIKNEKVEFVDLEFTDIPGRLQHVTMPWHSIEEDTFTKGIPKLDGSSIRGFTEIYESDLVLVPDPSTFAVMPWLPDNYKTARMICDVHWGFGQGRFANDPRAIAQKAEAEITKQGYDLSYWGPELEFFVFDKVYWDVHNPYQGQSYKIESKEAAWNTTGTNYPIRFKEGYFPVPPQDTLMEFRSECCSVMEKNFNIVTDAHHHEVATAGQCEIDMLRDTLTSTADNVVTYKMIVKNVAYTRGMVATFMPKPVFMDNASGMHVHVSLWKGGNPLFYDGSDPHAELSQLGRYFAGGLMAHARAMAAITNPTTNSYRRLVPGYEAPVYIAWSRRNRSANIRVPCYEKGQKTAARKRLEYRTPDPSSNPYLCFAAMTAAGLDGIKKKLDPGDPVDENIYHLTPEKRHELGIQELPGSLKEAAESLRSDHSFLKTIFPQSTIDYIIENGTNEHNQIALRTHPYEFQLYFDI